MNYELWFMKKRAALVFMFNGNQILLAKKKQGFGAGKWNGTGGKIEHGETEQQAAIRETQEEVDLTPALGDPVGTITYHNSSAGDWVVTVFRADRFTGSIRESEEMIPQWFTVQEIPYGEMWDGDALWLPNVIVNRKFRAEMWFNEHERNVKNRIEFL